MMASVIAADANTRFQNSPDIQRVALTDRPSDQCLIVINSRAGLMCNLAFLCTYVQDGAQIGLGHMAIRFASAVVGLGAGLLACLPAPLDAAGSDPLAARGKLVLQEKCGRCHAIEAVGESPLKIAPPMRDIYARFAPRELQAELSEGMVSKHKEMPQIDFPDEDVDAILAYLYALAVRK
jgi:mono/diheme cytochrome c family protein